MKFTIEASESRIAAVLQKFTAKGYHTLDKAEAALLAACDAQTLRVVPNSHKVNGCAVGRFYQVEI